MGTLNVYNFISLNGFYKDAADGIAWGRHDGEEEKAFSGKNAQSGSTLVFGRKTYEMMYRFWPTPAGHATQAETAEGMSAAEKIVFSRTLKKADWHNSRVVAGDIAAEIKRLKDAGKVLTILGSGSIVAQLTAARLVDTFMVMVNPIVLSGGAPIFTGIPANIELELVDHRIFKSGRALLTYRPVYS
ncbi:MAG TPA: dihydrofolate reductase family protein [Puia sp.]|nr:dihydrofolate reductase family protein [Puia sp.]